MRLQIEENKRSKQELRSLDRHSDQLKSSHAQRESEQKAANLLSEKRQKSRQFKLELDKQRGQKESMMAYGNMSAAEKQMNKRDLLAYKCYDQTNHALLPGINSHSQLPKVQSSSPTKPMKDKETKHREN